MREFVFRGARYRITKSGARTGWPCPETYTLEQIHTAQRSKRHKAEFYDEARRLMRACTPDELLRYVAQISGAEVDEVVGGHLNPLWVEWLMGWPIGHTGLEPLETARYQEWLRWHGGF